MLSLGTLPRTSLSLYFAGVYSRPPQRGHVVLYFQTLDFLMYNEEYSQII